MPTTRIKEKISTLVSSQLPEFIQSDYATFIAFLEAYYEFLEQDQGAHEVIQNIRSYNDIDRTVDSFIEYFIKQYSDIIPRSILADKKLLLKNIETLYSSKGSEKSYRLLFQILYNKKIDFYYPYQQVLKASDGKWVQRTSFFMRTITGDGSSVIEKNTVIKSPLTTYPIYIQSRRNASTSTGIVGNTHEYFYDNRNNVTINIGDIIEYENFKGEVVGAAVQAIIQNPGAGFKVGDILPLTSGVGSASKLKVTKVNSTGGIVNVQFLNFGIGYLTDFYNFFSSTPSVPPASSFSYSGGVVTIIEQTSGFVDYGTITRPSYAEAGFFAADYSGEVLLQFFNDASLSSSTSSGTSVTTSTGTSQDAVIYVRLGASAKYQGYYSTTDGFLSDTIYLEDQDYYQPFSYVLRVDERLSDYKKVVLDLLHPAGTKLFGDLVLTAEIDILTEIATVLRYLTSYFQDQFGVSDFDSKHVEKSVSDFLFYDDSNTKNIQKPFSHSTVATDAITNRLWERTLANSIIVSDIVFNYSFSKALQETILLTESFLITGINNITPRDSLIVSDSGSAINFNYASSTYFAGDYAGSITTF